MQKETETVDYQKLFKSGFLIGYRIVLSCHDHLLYIENPGGYQENYKRFFFNDILAIKVRYHRNLKAIIVGLLLLIQVTIYLIFRNDFLPSLLNFYATSFVGLLLLELWLLFSGSPTTATLKTPYGSEQLFLGSNIFAQRRLRKIINCLRAAGNPPLDSDALTRLADSDKTISI